MFYNTAKTSKQQATFQAHRKMQHRKHSEFNGGLPDAFFTLMTQVFSNDIALATFRLIVAAYNHNGQFSPCNFSTNEVVNFLGYTRKTIDNYILKWCKIGFVYELETVRVGKGCPPKRWSINLSRVTFAKKLTNEWLTQEIERMKKPYKIFTTKQIGDKAGLSQDTTTNLQLVDEANMPENIEKEIKKCKWQAKRIEKNLLDSDQDVFTFTLNNLPENIQQWRQITLKYNIEENPQRYMSEWMQIIGTSSRNTVLNTLKAIGYKSVAQYEEKSLLEAHSEDNIEELMENARNLAKDMQKRSKGRSVAVGIQVPDSEKIMWLNPKEHSLKQTLNYYTQKHGHVLIYIRIQIASLYLQMDDQDHEVMRNSQEYTSQTVPEKTPENKKTSQTLLREHFVCKHQVFFDTSGEHLSNEEIAIKIIDFESTATPEMKATVKERFHAFVERNKLDNRYQINLFS